MISDQDVLTALLASEEFAWVPLRFLLRGKDIVQYFGPYGYTLRERLIHLSGRRPAFIHSQGPKPWLWKKGRNQAAQRAKLPLRSLSRAFALYARGSKIQAARSRSPTPWMASHSLAGSTLRALGFLVFAARRPADGDARRLVRVTKPLFRTRNQ